MKTQPHHLPVTATFVGIDPSLSATGIAVLAPGTLTTFTLDASPLTGPARLDALERDLEAALEHARPAFVATEGYGFGAKNHAHSLGELGGVFRLRLWRMGYGFKIVPPTSLKKFVTGSGNAEKGTIQKDLYKRWGLDLDNNNEADATALAIIAACSSGQQILLTQVQRAALSKCDTVPARTPPRHRSRPVQLVAQNA